MRYMKITSYDFSWPETLLKDQIFLELGPGPTLGLCPLSLHLGSSSAIAVEPMFNDQILVDQRFSNLYLQNLHHDLAAIFPRSHASTSFPEFQKLIKEKICTVRDINEVPESFKSRVGFVFSNSVLEHVSCLGSTLETLFSLMKPGSYFIHAVDFGDHATPSSPFEKIYDSTRTYLSGKNAPINSLRPSEMKSLFKDAGFDTDFKVYYRSVLPEQSKIDVYWRQFDEEELSIKVAFFFGKKP